VPSPRRKPWVAAATARPADYALANHIQHPLSVYLPESLIIGEVDRWLAREFAPHRMTKTVCALAEAQQADIAETNGDMGTAAKIAECDRKLAQYRATLDAGANPATVAGRIAEAEAEKASYALVMRGSRQPRKRMSEREIKAIVDGLANVEPELGEADPDDKSEIFRQLGLKLIYQPGRKDSWKRRFRLLSVYFRKCPRFDTHLTYMIDIALTTEFKLTSGGVR
jgi:hypothetical protein